MINGKLRFKYGSVLYLRSQNRSVGQSQMIFADQDDWAKKGDLSGFKRL